MKTLFSFLFCLSIVFSAQSQDMLKMYGIKSGILEYNHSGTSSSGTSTLYFDDYGQKSANYMVLTTQGKLQKSWIISLSEMQYIYDPVARTGQKMKNPFIEGLKGIDDLEKFTEDMYAKMGFKEAGTEKFLGRDCRVFKGDMGKVLTWNGILMLMEMSVMGTTSRQEATKVDVGVPVKASLFEVPADIKFTDLPSFGIE
jgi:hypothetical protein